LASKEIDVPLTHLFDFNLTLNPLFDKGHVFDIVIDRHPASSSARDHTLCD